MNARAAPPQAAKPVTLALQGGGAHGAFTWGVLDRLLADGRLDVRGISGTSAGAMNGALAVCGLVKGGADEARARLEAFWRKVSEYALLSPLQPTWLDRAVNRGGLEFSPAYTLFDLTTRLFSPYQLNVANFHPLRQILLELIDFDCVQSARRVPLFVTATNVRSGKLKIFDPAELSVDALLASACIPELFRAVEIDGEHYWDGGYMGNPAIFPLLEHCAANDVVLVQINPIATAQVPTTAREILDRINEISFNASLLREMRAIAMITRLIECGAVDERSGLKRFYIHMIEAEDVMSGLGFSTKLDVSWEFLCSLRDLGRARAEAWLTQNYGTVGVESSVDIDEVFL